MALTWRQAVVKAIMRLTKRHNTRKITRQQLIDEELNQIIIETNSQGITPSQTLSRILQELRNEDFLYFDKNGVYVLLDTPIDIEHEDLSEDAIDYAIISKRLQLGKIATDESIKAVRQRKGQSRIRSGFENI